MISVIDLRAEVNSTKMTDRKLSSLVNSVISQFETQTGLKANKRSDYTEVYHMQDDTQPSFFVPLCNISNLVITEWSDSEVEADAETLEATAFEATPIKYPPIGYRVRAVSGYFKRNVRITCDLGWDDSDLPADMADLQDALLVQARFLFLRNSDDRIAVSSQQGDTGTTNFISGKLHPQFAEIIKKYRWKL